MTVPKSRETIAVHICTADEGSIHVYAARQGMRAVYMQQGISLYVCTYMTVQRMYTRG